MTNDGKLKAVDASKVYHGNTEYSETSTSYGAAKDSFDVVLDSFMPPTGWRVVVSMKSGGTDEAACQMDIGGDTVEIVSSGSPTSYTVYKGDITKSSASEDTVITATIKLRRQSGTTDTVYLKYIDIFALY